MSLKKIFKYFSDSIKKSLILTIKIVRPLIGPRGTCKSVVNCTQYIEIQLQSEPFLKAILNIIKRLFKCSFFYSLYRKIKTFKKS